MSRTVPAPAVAAADPSGEDRSYPAPKAWIHPDRNRSWIGRLVPLLGARKVVFTYALVGTMLGIVAQVLQPRVVMEAIDKALDQRTAELMPFVLLLGVLALVRGVFGSTSRYAMFATAYGLEYDLRNIMYEHLARLSFSFYDRTQTGQLVSRANADVRAVQMFLAFAPIITVVFTSFLLALFLMLQVHVGLTLVSLIPLPLVYVFGVRMRREIFPVSWMVQARLADVATLVEENVTGVRIVRSFAAETHEIAKLTKAARKLRWSSVKQVDIRARFTPLMQNMPRVGLVIVLAYGGWLALNGTVSIGALVAFSSYVLMLQMPFQIIGFVLVMAEQGRAAAGRIYEIIDHEPEVDDAPGAPDLDVGAGAVSFRDVAFAYRDGPLVLDGFALDITPGETVALVGRTGCGKTTVARVLLRFYDVTSGRILVDEQDVRDVTQRSLRRTIGLVADDAFLFSDTIRENIAYGRPDATDTDITAAAVAAGADAFIRELPDGYDTLVGERGYTLSGGQRQRISIARTLLANPRVLVLDDATSSVDVKVEQEIHGALRTLLEGRTTLIIAHRLSTISLADRVVLMERGRIAAQGTHADLMRDEPRYRAVLAQIEDERARLEARPAPRPMPRPQPAQGPMDTFRGFA